VIFSFVILTVGTELIIKWNHVDGLEGVDKGQWIPLIGGGVLLVRAIAFRLFHVEPEP
jgi:hypothetical protein